MSILTFQQQTAIKPISKNNATMHSQLLVEVLNIDLVNLLGAAFVTALKSNPTDDRFTAILDANNFVNCYGNTVSFEGLRYVIAYLVYARYVRAVNVKDTFNGLVRQNRTESEHVGDATIRAMQQEAKDAAVSQLKLIEEYLTDNSETYPEWEKGLSKKGFRPRIINLRKTYK